MKLLRISIRKFSINFFFAFGLRQMLTKRGAETPPRIPISLMKNQNVSICYEVADCYIHNVLTFRGLAQITLGDKEKALEIRRCRR